MKLFIILLVCTLAVAKENPAPYIHAKGRPLNIAHRGLSSIIPENTLPAF